MYNSIVILDVDEVQKFMFGQRLKELRLSLGMNQVQFGKTLNITKQSVSNWENGNIQPSVDMIVKIANRFSVSCDYLLGLDEKRTIDVTGLTDRQIANLQSLADDLRKSDIKR